MTVQVDEVEETRGLVRQAVKRHDAVAAARAATQAGVAESRWDVCLALELPGALLSTDDGGLALPMRQLLVCLEEFAGELMAVPLAGHWAATHLMAAAGEVAEDVARGRSRAVLIPARPPIGTSEWSSGAAGTRDVLPRAVRREDGSWAVTGRLEWARDVAGADVLILLAQTDDSVAAFAIDQSQPGVRLRAVQRYDHTTPLGHLDLIAASARRLDVDRDVLEASWALAQAFAGAEALGVARRCLDLAVDHAKQRYAFGRAIGSYQAVKHRLVEMLRLIEIAHTLAESFAEAWDANDAKIKMAGVGLRVAGERAQGFATASNIFVHGGVGATWEHDAPYYYRRAQLRRTLQLGADQASWELGAVMVEAAERQQKDG